VENSALQHVLDVLSFLSKTHCKALLSICMDTQQRVMMDFFLWGHLKDLVYQEPIRDFHHLQQRIRQ
jgi:hypothetical protein